MPAPQLQIGDRAPDFSALDVHGNAVEASSLWPHGPTLLTFLRHYG